MRQVTNLIILGLNVLKDNNIVKWTKTILKINEKKVTVALIWGYEEKFYIVN